MISWDIKEEVDATDWIGLYHIGELLNLINVESQTVSTQFLLIGKSSASFLEVDSSGLNCWTWVGVLGLQVLWSLMFSESETKTPRP